MADTKVSALTADASPSGDDLLYVVNDPGGSPAGRKVTIANLEASLAVANMSDASSYALNTTLASTSNGEGASLIGIEDAGGLITATTVEGALAENRAAIDALEAAGYITATLTDEEVQDIVGAMFSGNTETRITATYQDADGTIDLVVDDDLANYSNANSGFAVAATLASTATSAGASLIGIEDSGANFTGSDLETVLGEIASDIDTLETAGYITDVTGDNLSALADVTITTIASGELLKWNGSAWVNNTLAEAGIAAASHTHAASEIVSGTLAHERGGLEADVSAYSGLVKISGGATSAVTDNSSNWDTAYGWGDHSSAGYVPDTRQVIAGDGLSDGGALSGNVTINLDIFGQTNEGSPSTTDVVVIEAAAGGSFRKTSLAAIAALASGSGDAWSSAVDSDIVPTGADSTYDIGTTTDRFAEGWFDDITAGNSVSAGDGSVTSPGFKFAGDTNNGLYRIGTDNWALAVGSIKALELLDTGSGNAVFYWEANTGITASATQTQGQGALLSSYNEISTVTTTNDVVTLRTAAAGLKQTIVNNGANTLQIFPASGDDLGAGVDTSTTLAAGDSITFFAADATNWATIASTASSGGASQLTDLSDVSGATTTSGFVLVANGSTYAGRALVEADISDLGTYVATSDIGSTVQAYDADLDTWAGITPGTGVGTALAVNVGSAGAFVTNGGALGTPSGGTLTNATGLPVSTGISGLGTGVATMLATPSAANFNSALSDGTFLFADDADQTITGGANVTVLSSGTKSSGTYTMDFGARPLQYIVNGGAFTLAPDGSNGNCVLLITNNASAGAITTSGWTMVTGDAFDTTNTNQFMCYCVSHNDGTSDITHLHVTAMQ